MSRTRIKICGITQPEDAAIAGDLGADAIGLNFFAGPRKVDRRAARAILDAVTPLVTPVALTDRLHPVDGSAMSVREIPSGFPSLAIATFQLYKAILWDLIDATFDGQYWPVFGVSSRYSFAEIHAAVAAPELRGVWPSRVTALLLDTAVPGQLGGTGQTFNWHWIAEARAAGELEGLPPIILAGGLTPDNVADAIRIARPYAVDVSSGVEFPGQPGKKDPARLKAFIQAVRSTDA